ncbi:hypothetical protein, partial [Helicobacter pylori]|uniref:hypothetical protein n=1 Tax=Helicobacter pylori TaxID=210 RepID=UPI001E505362
MGQNPYFSQFTKKKKKKKPLKFKAKISHKIPFIAYNTKFLCIKEKSNKRRKHENQKIPLALSFSHGFIIKG